MQLTADNLKHVVGVLKKRFGNLTAEETIELASAIIEGLQSPAPIRWFDVNDPTKHGVLPGK